VTDINGFLDLNLTGHVNGHVGNRKIAFLILPILCRFAIPSSRIYNNIIYKYKKKTEGTMRVCIHDPVTSLQFHISSVISVFCR